jgi:hypothetical protein
MRNILDERCRKNQSTFFIFNNFFSENRAVYELMWKNMGKTGNDDCVLHLSHCCCLL